MSYTIANIAGRAVLVSQGKWFDIHRISNGALGPDPMSVVGAGAELSALNANIAAHTADGDVDSAKFDAPVPRPSKAFGIGLNYREHANEASMEVPDNPVVFAKFPNCITGPNGDVLLRSDRCDYEGELVVVIGKAGKDISTEHAWDHVLGFTIGQDVSDRQVQLASKPPHFDLGKSFDTFGPIGPVIVSLDQFRDRSDIQLRTLINGEQRQADTTASMIFDVPALVSYLSKITTLVEGDLIFTGTPSGVGMVQKKLLVDGDVITTEIEGIGRMDNRCVRISDHQLPLKKKTA